MPINAADDLVTKSLRLQTINTADSQNRSVVSILHLYFSRSKSLHFALKTVPSELACADDARSLYSVIATGFATAQRILTEWGSASACSASNQVRLFLAVHPSWRLDSVISVHSTAVCIDGA